MTRRWIIVVATGAIMLQCLTLGMVLGDAYGEYALTVSVAGVFIGGIVFIAGTVLNEALPG